MLLAKQIALPLSQPINHHEKLHHAAHGAVLYWEAAKENHRWTKILPGDPVEKLIAGFAGGSDTYLTVNEFYGWRNVRQIKSLRACYVDIDGTADLDLVLEALQAEKMPAPSFVVFSGRGLHLYWLLAPIPGKALPVWQHVQDALIKALEPIGADRKARDCTRVLRLVGTKNGKNDAEVRGLVLSDTVWTLHELADEVLGERQRSPKARVFDLAAAGARKHKPIGKVRAGTIYDWWHLVYRDLITIADYHWFGGVRPGHRDQMLFYMSVALSWFAHPDVLKEEIEQTARSFTQTLTSQEVEAQMRPVLTRAMHSAEGKKLTWQGKEVDPRYRYKAETLREALADLIVPELHGQLRALAPAEIIQQRKKERDAGRDRVAEGRYKQHREDYLNDAKQRGVSARLLKAQGKTAKEIAEELGISRMSVSRYLKESV